MFDIMFGCRWQWVCVGTAHQSFMRGGKSRGDECRLSGHFQICKTIVSVMGIESKLSENCSNSFIYCILFGVRGSNLRFEFGLYLNLNLLRGLGSGILLNLIPEPRFQIRFGLGLEGLGTRPLMSLLIRYTHIPFYFHFSFTFPTRRSSDL